jgi:hypothetical protein
MDLRSHLLVLPMLCAASLFSQTPAWQPAPGHVTLPIWPQGVPGTAAAGATAPAEVDTTTAKDNLIAGKPLIRLGNISTPTMTLYKPAKANGATPAVVVFPGGGYRILAIDLEGTEVPRPRLGPLSQIVGCLAGRAARGRPGAPKSG